MQQGFAFLRMIKKSLLASGWTHARHKRWTAALISAGGNRGRLDVHLLALEPGSDCSAIKSRSSDKEQHFKSVSQHSALQRIDNFILQRIGHLIRSTRSPIVLCKLTTCFNFLFLKSILVKNITIVNKNKLNE